MPRAMLRQLLARRRRLSGIGLAVLIGTGFLALTMLFGQVIEQGFRNVIGEEYAAIDFAVEPRAGAIGAADVPRLETLDGVADVQPAITWWIELRTGNRGTGIPVTPLPDRGPLRDGLALVEGSLPDAPGEIVLNQQMARDLAVGTGDRFEMLLPTGDGDPVLFPVTIVGIWSGEGRFGPDDVRGFLHPDDAALLLAEAWIPALWVTTDPGADADAVAGTIRAALPAGLALVDREALIDAALADYQDELAIQQAGVSAFAVLALIVTGLVIANTCAILVAQRAREIALFRCAGATATQVRTMVVSEAVAVGLVAAAGGVALALGVANLALRLVHALGLFDTLPQRVAPTAGAVVLPVAAGALVILAASWGPARTAARIDPLRALRSAQAPPLPPARMAPVQAGAMIVLLAVGGLLLFGGAFLARGGDRTLGILVGLAGGLLTLPGALLGASILVPAINRLLVRLAGRLGTVPGRVATANVARNPRRATASAVALMIGVALVTMMTVGAASLKATMANEIDARAPWDIDLTYAGELDETAASALATDVAAVEGVAVVAPVGRILVEIGSPAVTVVEAWVIDPAHLSAIWRDPAAVAPFEPGTMLLPPWLFDEMGFVEGQVIDLTFGETPATLRAVAIPRFDNIIVAPGDLPPGAPMPLPRGLLLRLDEGADAGEVLDAVYDLAAGHGIALMADGRAGYRETLTSALDTMLYVVSTLLAVAILIAVVGIGNTLSLAVIERTAESGLLRALGYTRRQVQRTLLYEGALLASIGGIVGLVMGMAFGWIGAVTVVGDAWPVQLAFPAGRLALILALAIACGVIASVRPARRAAMVDPVVALAGA